MLHFYDIFPETAKAEGRLLICTDPTQGPTGSFLFTEYYCIEGGCDCRRVILKVVHAESKATVATINHSFEPPPAGHIDADLGQTFLDPLNEQSAWSKHFLNLLVGDVLDDEYCSRLVRHYEMVKKAVEDRRHPLNARLARIRAGNERRVYSPRAKVGRNEPCPCGSGRKFKHCCDAAGSSSPH